MQSGPTDEDKAYISERRMSTFVTWVSTLLATVLLIGAIVSLHVVQSASLKLGMIALFMVLFAGSVGLLTNARRTEVFGATAAYVSYILKLGYSWVIRVALLTTLQVCCRACCFC